jgi:hypothetical protein
MTPVVIALLAMAFLMIVSGAAILWATRNPKNFDIHGEPTPPEKKPVSHHGV